MDAEKIYEVLDLYRQKFNELGIDAKRHPLEVYLTSPKQALEHCHAMLSSMTIFTEEGELDKVFRWLGFLQGVLWTQKIYSLTELSNHNRSDPD